MIEPPFLFISSAPSKLYWVQSSTLAVSQAFLLVVPVSIGFDADARCLELESSTARSEGRGGDGEGTQLYAREERGNENKLMETLWTRTLTNTIEASQ